MNTTLFHCIGTVVLLESAASAIRAVEGAEPARAEVARVDELREYAKSVWPEFDWDTACSSAVARCAGVRSGWAPHAARDVVGSYVPDFYAALLNVVEDPALRSAIGAIVAMRSRCDETTTRRAPRAAGARCVMAMAAPRAQAASVRTLRSIFDMLQHHWVDTPPFPVLDYGTAITRAWSLLASRLEIAWSDRLLLKLWLRSALRKGATPVGAAAPVRSRDCRAAGNAAHPASYALPQAATLR